jgi:cGMP-dependent protein kinase
MLQHLHEKFIIHRDLKPENIVVGKDGYPYLIDFGTAKIVQERTYTGVGTPHYMAPELLSGMGYGVSVDYWSLGVMLYEFVSGEFPFGNDCHEVFQIYKAIIEDDYEPPANTKMGLTTEFQELLALLLAKHPSKRKGGSISIFMTHPWFTIDFDDLILRQITPPTLVETDEEIMRPGSIFDVIDRNEE